MAAARTKEQSARAIAPRAAPRLGDLPFGCRNAKTQVPKEHADGVKGKRAPKIIESAESLRMGETLPVSPRFRSSRPRVVALRRPATRFSRHASLLVRRRKSPSLRLDDCDWQTITIKCLEDHPKHQMAVTPCKAYPKSDWTLNAEFLRRNTSAITNTIQVAENSHTTKAPIHQNMVCASPCIRKSHCLGRLRLTLSFRSASFRSLPPTRARQFRQTTTSCIAVHSSQNPPRRLWT